MEKKSATVKTQDNHKIFYDQYLGGHKRVAVIAHGFFNSKDSELIKKIAMELVCFIDVITFDFRGHGKSEGLFYWTSKEYLDLEAMLDIANKKYQKTGLIGFSLGAATSIITVARSKQKVDSLIAVSAPTEFEKIDCKFWDLDVENDIIYNLGDGKKGKGVRPGPFWLKKDKPINVAKDIKIPVLYIHGDADWVILPKHSQTLYQKTVSKKHIIIIPGGVHAEYLMRFHEEEFIKSIRNWFEKTMLLEVKGDRNK